MILLKLSRSPATLLTTRKISTVHRGTAFEERALKLFKDNFSMSLKRVGGRGDGGIDLLGWWWLPPPTYPAELLNSAAPTRLAPAASEEKQKQMRRRIRVIGQCKAEKKKMGPKYVRELEGVMYRLMASAALSSPSNSSSSLIRGGGGSSEPDSPTIDDLPHTQDEPTIAILVSQSPFTQATLLRAQSSPIPLLLLHLPIEHPADERVSASAGSTEGTDRGAGSTAVWNMALGGSQGLLQGQMEVRWERDLSAGGAGKPGLWWGGRKLGCWIPKGG